MIYIIDYHNAYARIELLDKMFLARSKVFTDRLGWVPSMNDREVDQFDTLMAQPVYLVSVDPDTQEYWGSVRLLRTTNINMLANVFPYIIPEQKIPKNYNIMELSRFNVTEKDVGRNKYGISNVVGELLYGLGAISLLWYVEEYVAVFDEKMYKILRLSGLDIDILQDPPYNMGGTELCYAGMFSYNSKVRAKVTKLFNLEEKKIKVEF